MQQMLLILGHLMKRTLKALRYRASNDCWRKARWCWAQLSRGAVLCSGTIEHARSCSRVCKLNPCCSEEAARAGRWFVVTCQVITFYFLDWLKSTFLSKALYDKANISNGQTTFKKSPDFQECLMVCSFKNCNLFLVAWINGTKPYFNSVTSWSESAVENSYKLYINGSNFLS